MRTSVCRAVRNFLAAAVSAALFPLIAYAEPASQMISIDQVRQIVREELRAREQELEAREKKIEERERSLDERLNKLEAREMVASQHTALSDSLTTAPAENKFVRASGPFSLEIGGYGEVQADFYSYEENINQSEGSRGQSKTTFDTERFVLEIEGKHEPSEIELEAEIEFEHGGTGSALELEYEEFGEYENEIEKGGEVILEELYLEKEFDEDISLKVGRFYVAFNTLSRYYRPTDYLGVRRSEVEEVMLPGQWDEIGISVEKGFDFGSFTLQLVNGLDSTGFGSSRWIAGGHQSRFEVNRAEDIAVVGRFETDKVLSDLVLGASIYAGNTSGNRTKDDLEVDGTLVLGTADFRYWTHVLKTQGAIFLGDLSDAEEISDRNSRLPNTLGVDRTPVADGALGLWTEIGFNVSPYLGLSGQHELMPFFRFDYYDTYYDTRDSLIDNPRFERSVYSAGIAYFYDEFISLKANWSRRVFGTSDIDDEDFFSLGVGFVY